MRRIRHMAAVGAVVSLLSLCVAPGAAAAPRAEESAGGPRLLFQDVVESVLGLFGGWFESWFAPSGGGADPDG